MVMPLFSWSRTCWSLTSCCLQPPHWSPTLSSQLSHVGPFLPSSESPTWQLDRRAWRFTPWPSFRLIKKEMDEVGGAWLQKRSKMQLSLLWLNLMEKEKVFLHNKGFSPILQSVLNMDIVYIKHGHSVRDVNRRFLKSVFEAQRGGSWMLKPCPARSMAVKVGAFTCHSSVYALNYAEL